MLVRTPRSKQEPLVSCRAQSPAAGGDNVLLPRQGVMGGPEAELTLEQSS